MDANLRPSFTTACSATLPVPGEMKNDDDKADTVRNLYTSHGAPPSPSQHLHPPPSLTTVGSLMGDGIIVLGGGIPHPLPAREDVRPVEVRRLTVAPPRP